MLRVVSTLRQSGINLVVCGGWVPFLKELARTSCTVHSMSLDIDLMLRAAARERQNVDRVSLLLSQTMGFQRNEDATFRYEKRVQGSLVQLDLMADLARIHEDQSILQFPGVNTSLDLCLIDGGEELGDHVESIRIDWRDGEHVESCDLTIPDAVGFLILKTAVCRYREKSKDPYDIYYYCRYSEAPDLILKALASNKAQPAIARTVAAMQRMFRYEDSKWVEMVLDHMNVTGDDRDREAKFIVRAVTRIVAGL
jgi:hypothetical protein